MSKLSTRLSRLRDDVMSRKGSFIKDVNPCLTHVARWKAERKGSPSQMRSDFLYHLVEMARIDIYPNWSLCGEHLCEPARFMDWPDDESKVSQYLAELGLCAELADQIRNSPSWEGSRKSDFCPVADDDTIQGMGQYTHYEIRHKQPEMVYWSSGWVENHSIRDFALVIAKGFGGLRSEVRAKLDKADIADADYAKSENFWRAAIRVCDAGLLLGKRYSTLATEKAQQLQNEDDKARLLAMAAACEKIVTSGADTFYEAVQMLWLAHILTCGEDGINANSIGRLDQILWPYYKADIAAGRIDRQEALELMIELALKMYLEYDVQAITLGGCDSEGKTAVNELSYIILEATDAVDFVRDLSVRIGDDTPQDFIDLSSSLVIKGGGIPFFFNDNCFIQALVDRGIELADARDYAPIGCVELTIPGKANPHAVSGWFNSTKCIEYAINNGRSFDNDKQVGPQTGEFKDFKTFDEFYDAYRKQIDFFARRMAYHINRGELLQQQHGPLPLWSLLTDNCIERGRDITDCGAKYNYHSICLLGAPNTADSLYAVKKLYFEDKRISGDELLSALAANFQGYEPLRQMLLQDVAKYGNDGGEVDEIARRVCDDFIDLMDTFKSPLGGRYFVHLFSFYCNLNFGYQLWATPDGRKAGEPIAYSLSAGQGRDIKGVTAMLNSLAKMPHSKAAGGSAAIIEIDPKLVSGSHAVDLMRELVRTAFNIGVGQLQWNIVTVERLRKAQQDPENYGNISVRVAGFSQMFKLLGPSLQEHIINRTKHTS